ncbi:uncharacterized protein Z520_07386 [Fonsecaea multimorphosa CBS 102226]|uniref:Uncharacterized protein n=1 Tax=Fonsecaea multimorphosa CBS 102226 TaxID=1442371 RepID=A0A0D2JT65_9EURO|nr:uncharacterized protein Z520_07386 [Fonsecaea multimorphosa CBS 102226]KIX96667.1 hypothetical protein Z520_07386 [Fonsecaea multimorphosa CBS 102226]
MSNGCNRLLCGSVGSNLVTPYLTFRTSCCRYELSVSHIVRLERYRVADSKCCCQSEGGHPPGAFSPLDAPNRSLGTAHNARRNVPPNGWLPGAYRVAGRGLRRDLNIQMQVFHTRSGSSLKAPSLPKKPLAPPQSATLLPPPSSLPQRTNLPHPPYVSVGPLSVDKSRAGIGAGADISLPNSPVQAREREKERHRREAARQLELAREKEEKIRMEQKLIKARAEKQRAQEQAAARARQENIASKREEWMHRYREAQELARKIELFPWSDKAGIDHYLQCSRLLERAKHLEAQLTEWYSEGGPNEQTRDLGNAIYFDVSDALSDENFAPILRELNDTDRYWAYFRNPDIIKDEKPGTSLPTRIRLRLYEILWLRYQVIDTALVIARTLHDLRQIRRLKAQLLCSTEIFSHYKLTFPLELLANAINVNAERIMDDYFHLRRMSGLFYKPSSRRLRKLFYESAFPLHAAKLRWLSRSAVRDLRQNFEGLLDTTVQRELFPKLRPLIAHNRDFVSLRNTYTGAINLFNNPLSSPSTRLLMKIQEAWGHLFNTQRDVLLLTEFLMLWSGVRKIWLDGPSRQGDRHITRASAPAASHGPRYNVEKFRANVKHVVPWRTPTSLYPLGTAIPIHYVLTYSGLQMVLPRFTGCKILGFDTIQTAKTRGTSLVEFLILASDHEVAIIHIALMSQLSLVSKEPFVDIMQDDSILKVGVDVEFQRQLLLDGPSIELEGAVELCNRLNCDVSPGIVSSKDRSGSIISSMAAQVFGYPLPAVNLPQALRDLLLGTEFRAIRRIGSIEPLQLLTHLASRAYAVLQLYRVFADEKTKPTSSLLLQSNIDEPSLGPVLVYRQSGVNNDGLLRKRGLPRQRLLHLASIAEHWAATIFWARVHTNDFKKLSRREQKVKREKAVRKLTAYSLFTTFNESLDTIQRHMGMRLVATEILAISHQAKLPLRPRDVELLDFWRKWTREENFPQSEVHEDAEYGISAADFKSHAPGPTQQLNDRTTRWAGSHTVMAKPSAARTVQSLPRSGQALRKSPHDLATRPSQKKTRAPSTAANRRRLKIMNAEQTSTPSKPSRNAVVSQKPRLADLSARLDSQPLNVGQGIPT